MSKPRGDSKSLRVGEDRHEPRPMKASTLKLFITDTTAVASVDSTDAPAPSPVSSAAAAAVAAAPLTAKNPRWLANREKEMKCEALRDKIMSLLDDIEAEEAKDRPVLKKAWLRAKRLELRRISFKQPDEVIAVEAYFRRTRRKLRKAQRRRREQDHGAEEGDSVDESESDADDSAASAPSEETAASETAKATRSWTVPGPGGEHGLGDKQRKKKKMKQNHGDDEDNDGSQQSDHGSFNLNPTGRIARPNPRAKSNETDDTPKKVKKVPKSLERLNKIVRLPVESGFKLGRMIRKHRNKARQRHRSHSDDGDSGESDGEGDSDHWGNRVGNGRLRATGATAESDSDNADAVADSRKVVRVIIDGDSGDIDEGSNKAGSRRRDKRRGSADSNRKCSSSSSSLADIPVLQESVGKKIRDRLTVRRGGGGGGGGRPKSGGSSGSANDLSGDSARRSDCDRGKEKPKDKKAKKEKKEENEEKEKEKKEKKKEKEKKEKKEKKNKKGKADVEESENEDGSSSGERRHQSSKKSGVQHRGNSALEKKSSSAASGEPMQFVELEDDSQ